MIMPWAQVRVRVYQKAPGELNWHQIPSTLLTNPLEPWDWKRLFQLRIDVIGDKQGRAGVAFNPTELRELLEAIVGKKMVHPPAAVQERMEREAGSTPTLNHGLHWDAQLGETKSPSKIFGPTARQPLGVTHP